MKSNPTPSRARAFTLIELLVVIVIISVLAGLLLPVFTSIQEKSRETKCASNMRQLGAAFLLFAGEHNNQLPGNYDTRDKNKDDPDLLYQGSWLSGKNSDTNEVDKVPMKGTIYPYVNDLRVFRCPSLRVSARIGDGLGSNGLYDYAFFKRMGGARLQNVPTQGRVQGKPCALPMLIEEDPMSYLNSDKYEIDGTHGVADQAAQTHRGGCNYVSVDGSVHRIETTDKTKPILAQDWEANLDGTNFLNIGMPDLTNYGDWVNGGTVKQ